MASETPFSHSAVVESTSSAVSSMCDSILSKLKDSSFSEEDIFAVHLALEEAFINAVRHGNQTDSTKEVKIDYLVAQDRVEVTVADEGEGFDPDSVPDPRYGENLFKPEGRGLFLIRSYMDVVNFNEHGNIVHMVKYKEKPNSAEGEKQTQS